MTVAAEQCYNIKDYKRLLHMVYNCLKNIDFKGVLAVNIPIFSYQHPHSLCVYLIPSPLLFSRVSLRTYCLSLYGNHYYCFLYVSCLYASYSSTRWQIKSGYHYYLLYAYCVGLTTYFALQNSRCFCYVWSGNGGRECRANWFGAVVFV